MSDWWRLACVSAALAVLVWAALGPGGLAPTTGLQHDTEGTNASVAAADDLTVEAKSVTVAPGVLSPNASGNATISLVVPSPERVDESTLAVTFADGQATAAVPPSAATCEDECRVVLPESRVAALADGAGTSELVVRGWWEYDRAFVARAQVVVENADDGEKGTTTANRTKTTNVTTNGTTTGTTTRATNTTTQEPTTTATQNATTTAAQNATTTATATTATTTTATATTTDQTTQVTTTEQPTQSTTETEPTQTTTTTAANRTKTPESRSLPSLSG